MSFNLGVIGTVYFGLFDKGWGTCLNITTMFVGAVYFRRFKNEISNRAFCWLLLFVVFLVLNITFWNLIYKTHPLLKFLPYTTATLGTFIVFTICFYLKSVRYPKILVYLGVISYSIYLNQEIVFKLIPKTDNAVFTIIIWLSFIIALSLFTYNLIEKPFMKMGRLVKKAKTVEVDKLVAVPIVK